jgi:hypothetical protein
MRLTLLFPPIFSFFLLGATAVADIYNCDGTWSDRPCKGQPVKHIVLSPLQEGILNDLKQARTALSALGIALDISTVVSYCSNSSVTQEACTVNLKSFIEINKRAFERGAKELSLQQVHLVSLLGDLLGVGIDSQSVFDYCRNPEIAVAQCEERKTAFMEENRGSILVLTNRLKQQQYEERVESQMRLLSAQSFLIMKQQDDIRTRQIEDSAQLEKLNYQTMLQNSLEVQQLSELQGIKRILQFGY